MTTGTSTDLGGGDAESMRDPGPTVQSGGAVLPRGDIEIPRILAALRGESLGDKGLAVASLAYIAGNGSAVSRELLSDWADVARELLTLAKTDTRDDGEFGHSLRLFAIEALRLMGLSLRRAEIPLGDEGADILSGLSLIGMQTPLRGDLRTCSDLAAQAWTRRQASFEVGTGEERAATKS